MKYRAQRAKLTWNADRFDALERISAVLRESEFQPLYASYIAYLELRERGLRKQSFAQLDIFIGQIISDPFEVRLSIVQYLIGTIEGYWDCWPAPDNWQLPEQIFRRLIGPLWREWREREPNNPEAWLYSFGRTSVEAGGSEVAFLLDPTGHRYQYAFLNELGHKLNYELHELEHIGTILCEPAYFGELAASASAVAEAMGENITAEAVGIVGRLKELADIYRNYDRKNDILVDTLKSMGRQDLIALYVLPAPRWFRVLPDPLG